MSKDQLNKMYGLYYKNEKFKEYVDKYCKNRDLLLVDALQHNIVIEYGMSVADENYFDEDWRMMRHNGKN